MTTPASESDLPREAPPPGDAARAPAAPAPVPAAGRFSPRVVVVSLLALAIFVVAAFGVLQVFVVQRVPQLSAGDFEAAQQRWQQHGPDSYALDIEIRGARPGVVHLEVRDGQAASMTRDGRAPRERRTWDVWSVPGQFDMIERELEMAEDPEHEMQAAANTQLQLRAEFDPTYGFPRRFHRIVFGGGPEVYWRVTRFEVLDD